MVDSMTTKIILGFITLIVGIALLGSISSETTGKTLKVPVINETVDWTTARQSANMPDVENTTGFTLLNVEDTSVDCPMTGILAYNESGTALTEDTHFTLDENTGTFYKWNTTEYMNASSNITSVSYTYCPTGYLTSSWARSALNVVPGFFAIALMLVAIGLFYSAYAGWRKKD